MVGPQADRIIHSQITGCRHLRSTGTAVHTVTMTVRRPLRPRGRRWHLALQEPDRRALERAGWRTTLDYCENHTRSHDGMLVDLERRWRAEAERTDGEVIVASVSAQSAAVAWARLRAQVLVPM